MSGDLSNAEVSGFVLAGGRSSRMGSDKALVRFQGRTLLENALEIVSDAGAGSVRIAGARGQLGGRTEIVSDRFMDVGPMGGIHAGLAASETEWSLFLPVDMPLMPPSLLNVLMERAWISGCPVTVAKVNGRIEPFPVVLRRDVLEGLTERLREGKTACHAAWRSIPEDLGLKLDAVSVEYLAQAGQCRHLSGLPPTFWFQSANTPQNLEDLSRIVIKLPFALPTVGPTPEVS